MEFVFKLGHYLRTGSAAIIVNGGGLLAFGNQSAAGVAVNNLTLHHGAALTFFPFVPINISPATITVSSLLAGDASGVITLNVDNSPGNLTPDTTYPLLSFSGATLQNIGQSSFTLGTLTNVNPDVALSLNFDLVNQWLALDVIAIPEPSATAVLLGSLIFVIVATVRGRRW